MCVHTHTGSEQAQPLCTTYHMYYTGTTTTTKSYTVLHVCSKLSQCSPTRLHRYTKKDINSKDGDGKKKTTTTTTTSTDGSSEVLNRDKCPFHLCYLFILTHSRRPINRSILITSRAARSCTTKNKCVYYNTTCTV